MQVAQELLVRDSALRQYLGPQRVRLGVLSCSGKQMETPGSDFADQRPGRKLLDHVVRQFVSQLDRFGRADGLEEYHGTSPGRTPGGRVRLPLPHGSPHLGRAEPIRHLLQGPSESNFDRRALRLLRVPLQELPAGAHEVLVA